MGDGRFAVFMRFLKINENAWRRRGFSYGVAVQLVDDCDVPLPGFVHTSPARKDGAMPSGSGKEARAKAVRLVRVRQSEVTVVSRSHK